MWVFLALCLFVTGITSQEVLSQLKNPCPSILRYEVNKTNEWVGVLSVTSDIVVESLKLSIKFTGNVNYWGERVNSFEITQKRQLKPCETYAMRFPVNYFANSIPSVEKLTLNGIDVCPGTGMNEAIKKCQSEKKNEVLSKLVNPCPSILKYEVDNQVENTWTGVLTILADKEMKGLKLAIKFSNSHVLYWGSTLDNFVVTRPNELKPCEEFVLRFPVTYEENEEIPSVQKLELNNQLICPGVNVLDANNKCSGATVTTTTTPSNGADDLDDDIKDIFCSQLSGQNCTVIQHTTKIECGLPISAATSLITHGQITSKGQFPWHGALYYRRKGSKQYLCGVSLVSEKYAITASHCVTKSRTNRPVKKENLVIYFGKYLLNNWETTDIQEANVTEIIVHPEYDGTNFYSDIAILKWSVPVVYTDWVRPICLWSETVEVTHVISKLGITVGWGRNENDELNEVLTQVRMPVVDTLKCIYSNRDFFSKFTNPRTFCAGLRNGSSVCNGDSGGGMVFPITDTTPPRYQLRGVVSLSAAVLGKCDSNQYAIFTDAAKFSDWISSNMRE